MVSDRAQIGSEETPTAGDSSTTDESASLSELVGALDSRPRRRILVTLLHEKGEIPVEPLAESILAPDISLVADGSDVETA